jgi:hypothetical protein
MKTTVTDRTITATLPAAGLSNGRQPAKKELVYAVSVIGRFKGGKGPDGMQEAVCARFYMGRASSASVVYCSVWVTNGKDYWTSGKGDAGGGGYCKKSAALDDAIRSAGITLSRSVSGTGEIREACEAIARAFGYQEVLTITHATP